MSDELDITDSLISEMEQRTKNQEKYHFHLTTLKIKIKSLAAEAVIIRKEEQNSNGWRRNRLHNHRVVEVRRESRASHLVYGFLRGRRYEELEINAYESPDWVAFWRILRSRLQGSFETSQDFRQELAEWLDGTEFKGNVPLWNIVDMSGTNIELGMF